MGGMDCIFCKIVAGTLPAECVYEDSKTLAFLDITPVHPGHTLVIPKKHATDVFDIEEDEWKAVMHTARTVAHMLERTLSAHGVNVITNNRQAAGQIVFHSHVHVIPRFDGDGLKNWRGAPYAEGEARTIAEKMKSSQG